MRQPTDKKSHERSQSTDLPIIEVFRLRAWARAHLWATGEFDLREAVDKLAAVAKEQGIDTDVAQTVMAAEFGAVRC